MKWGLRATYQTFDSRSFDGAIVMKDDGSFEGEVTDSNPSVPQHIIKGYLRRGESIDTLQFLKFPHQHTHSNRADVLQKSANGSFEGVYEGMWKVLPVKTMFSKDYGIFVASIDVSWNTQGGGINIYLYVE